MQELHTQKESYQTTVNLWEALSAAAWHIQHFEALFITRVKTRSYILRVI